VHTRKTDDAKSWDIQTKAPPNNGVTAHKPKGQPGDAPGKRVPSRQANSIVEELAT